MKQKKRIAVLASGEGSNFEAIALAVRSGEIPGAQLCALLTNNPKAPAVQKARRLGVRIEIIDAGLYRRGDRFDRDAYEVQLLEKLARLDPDLICLAGYMLILGNKIIEAFADRILNIHPSLLPKFRGLNAVAKALAAGEKEIGCTVHWVVPAVDAGPIVVQKSLPVLDDETEKSLRKRLSPLEHAAYVEAIRKVLQLRLMESS